jgi:hypothetical protein
MNFISMKFKELLAEKGREGFLFNKIVTISISSFLTSFSAGMTSFFYGHYTGNVLLTCDGYMTTPTTRPLVSDVSKHVMAC